MKFDYKFTQKISMTLFYIVSIISIIFLINYFIGNPNRIIAWKYRAPLLSNFILYASILISCLFAFYIFKKVKNKLTN
jgi:hypothetical protein